MPKLKSDLPAVSENNAAENLPVPALDSFGLTADQRDILAAANAGYSGTSAPFQFKPKFLADSTTSKAKPRTIAKLTPRMHSARAGLRKAFGAEPFQARILDSGIAAILINSGMLLHVADTGFTESGIYSDAESRLMLRLAD